MLMTFYYSMFAMSMLLVVVYAFIFHKHFSANLTIQVVLIPIINLGFLFMGWSQNINEALLALRITYIGGCYVLVSAMFLIFNICDIEIKPWLRALIIVVSTGVYASTLTIGHSDLFYKGIPTLEHYDGAAYITNKQYGPMHTVFYIMVGLFYAAIIATIVYSFFKKKQVPITILVLISIAITIAVIGFFGSRFITNKVEILPVSYNIGLILYLIIASRLRLYDASDSVIDSLVQKGDTGFVSFDNKMRFLDSNDTAINMIPELGEIKVDKKSEWVEHNLLPWVEDYEKDSENDHHYLKREGKTYLIRVNRLQIGHVGHTHKGYQFLITDDTKNQEYIELIKNYNSQLEQEVEKKTKSVIEIQNKLVLGMATMVESRDNSTGGHIKRTSDGVRILLDTIKEEGSLNINESFYNNMIKAAPMHDIGKITIDDVILRKPGRFTESEYEIMKTHAEEGARIIKQILEGTDDKEFMNLAINVAHYHHERWNGSGYPKGLKGKEIPLEARIMAIADVYDALVSKRVYKESMSFELANKIIMDGMGSQFDKSLEDIYVKARPKLEEYYRSLDQ